MEKNVIGPASNPRAAGRAAIGRSVVDVTRRAWTGYWRRRAEHATIAILHGLDDCTLKDIGIDRSEIGSAAYRTSNLYDSARPP